MQLSRVYAPGIPTSFESTWATSIYAYPTYTPPDLGDPIHSNNAAPIPLRYERFGVNTSLDVPNACLTPTYSPTSFTGRITIDDFPTEVLELVLEFCTLLSQVPVPRTSSTSPAASSSSNTIIAPLVLTHICRRWRSIALRLPRIWSTISITRVGKDAGQIRLAACFLERSGSSPIDLTIALPRWIPAGRNHLDDVLKERGSTIQFRRIHIESKFGNPQEFVSSLYGHLDRLEEVSLYAHRAYIDLNSLRSISSLQRVALMFRHDTTSRLSAPIGDLASSLDYSRLTFLQILHEGALDVHQLNAILKQCENLMEGSFSLRHLPVSCRLMNPPLVQSQSSPTPRLAITVLQNLKHLALSYPITVTHELRNILNRSLSFPSLEILDLHVYPSTGTQHSPWCTPTSPHASTLPSWCWWSTTPLPVSTDPKPLDDTIDSCIPNFYALRKVTLQGIASTSLSCRSCPPPSDNFQTFFRSLPLLVELGVSDSPDGVDRVLRGLIPSCVGGADFEFQNGRGGGVHCPALKAIEVGLRHHGSGAINTSTSSGLVTTLRHTTSAYAQPPERANARDRLIVNLTLPSDDPTKKVWLDFERNWDGLINIDLVSSRSVSNVKRPVFFGEDIPDSFF